MNDEFSEPSVDASRGRGYFSQILRGVVREWRARVGLFWIGLLVLVAVFAPFLANSHPLLLSANGKVMSPLLASLTPTDVILLVMFFSTLALARIALGFWRRAMILAGIFLLTLGLSLGFVTPAALTVYEQYRENQEAGRYEWWIMAPIPYSPKDYQRDVVGGELQKPLAHQTRIHWFGTEAHGADVLSRMIHATRIALSIGFISTGIAMLIGVLVGGLMGYFAGIFDIVGMRLVEIFEAIPTLFLLLTFVAFFGPSLALMMVIIGITGWSGYARYVRAEFLKLRSQEFVQAAVACGLPLSSILFRHMLPNGLAPLLVAASFGVASAILAEATLSFLGLGLVDDPSWGQMLNQAVSSSTFHWWMAVFPGGAIFLSVFAYNLIGEVVRDALDPYLQQGPVGRN